MLLSELHNNTTVSAVRARVPIKADESTSNSVASGPKMRLREFLMLQELTGHLKKALRQ